MHTRSFIFFTRILARAQISSLTSEGFFIEVLSVTILETTKTTYIMYYCLLQFYRSQFWRLQKLQTKFLNVSMPFYRSQFWRLQKQVASENHYAIRFIGHNFGDYKNKLLLKTTMLFVLSVTILETTKTLLGNKSCHFWFYRSQFWRLQKQCIKYKFVSYSFIGHNFGDYKNTVMFLISRLQVLSVTILETTKTTIDKLNLGPQFYRSQFWRLQKPQMVSANYTIKVRSYSA